MHLTNYFIIFNQRKYVNVVLHKPPSVMKCLLTTTSLLSEFSKIKRPKRNLATLCPLSAQNGTRACATHSTTNQKTGSTYLIAAQKKNRAESCRAGGYLKSAPASNDNLQKRNAADKFLDFSEATAICNEREQRNFPFDFDTSDI